MKVDNSTTIPPVSNVTPGDSRKPIDGAATPHTTQNTASDDNPVRISQEASNLQSKETGTVVDVERVQQVKQAINDGTFQVNAEVVADRLVESSTELNLTRK